ncbi:MAG: hypothetical protein ACK56F_31730, partial [bacterium]
MWRSPEVSPSPEVWRLSTAWWMQSLGRTAGSASSASCLGAGEGLRRELHGVCKVGRVPSENCALSFFKVHLLK